MTAQQAKIAAQSSFLYLRPGGKIRLAVPDGYHPEPHYIEAVRPGGTDADSHDHKLLYNYQTLSELFVDAGFNMQLLEYFDESGEFYFHPWDDVDGEIRRSSQHDWRNADGKLKYTSVILDAVKPV